jgi:hypothetical protein
VERGSPKSDLWNPAVLPGKMSKAQLRYLRYGAEKDQARRMFKRLYGQEWTQEYIHGFLFDLERKLPQLISNKN